MSHKAHKIPDDQDIVLETGVAKKWAGIFGAMGAIGLLLSGVGFATAGSKQFFFSYLVAVLFCLSIALGALFFTMLQHLVSAHWSVVVRRLSEFLMSGIPILAVLFLPILAGISQLYHWADTHGHHDALLEAKAPYLNVGFFFARLAFYFLTWILLSQYFFKKSVNTDQTGDVNAISKMRGLSAPGIAIYALTQTFAAFDLIMSLTPHWYSTIFGVYFFSGSIVAAFAAITLLSLTLQKFGKLKNIVTVEHYHDLGKLIFAFTVFWTYIAFSQYFLIWYGNLPEETVYYLDRMHGTWKYATVFLLLGHFVFPFAILMSKHIKRNTCMLAVMCVWAILMQLLDIQWMVLPSLHHDSFNIHWLDFTSVLGVSGIFLAFIFSKLGKYKLVPVKDPYLERSMGFENA